MPSHYFRTDLADFLEGEPDILYESLRPMRGSTGFINYWRARQGDVWGDYMGALGRTALAGIVPSLTYTQFLNAYPFSQRFDQLSPRRRGTETARFRPRLRYNV